MKLSVGIGVGVASLVVGGLVVVSALSFLRGLDVEVFVYSHDGAWVSRPACLIRSPDEDFVSGNLPIIIIPAEIADSGAEMLATGPGCGLFRGTVRRSGRLRLPPPIRVTIEVPGQHDLPTDEFGLSLRFHEVGESPEVATLLARAPAAADYWEQPERTRNGQIFIDPATRSASVLLPCAGQWNIEWTHTDRPQGTFGIVFGSGEATIAVTADGQRHTLSIDPEDLESGWGGD